jgi:predicted aspartyl protease
MFILEALIVLVAIFVIATVINGIEDYHTRNSLVRLSFTDNMGRLNLPVVSLTNNGQSFNFLIDTGATLSVIDSNALDKLAYTKVETIGSAYGVDGNIIPVEYARIELNHENTKFVDEFQIMRVNGFDNIKKSDKIEIVGILGSTFLKRYDFTINYKDLIISAKKV